MALAQNPHPVGTCEHDEYVQVHKALAPSLTKEYEDGPWSDAKKQAMVAAIVKQAVEEQGSSCTHNDSYTVRAKIKMFKGSRTSSGGNNNPYAFYYYCVTGCYPMSFSQ